MQLLVFVVALVMCFAALFSSFKARGSQKLLCFVVMIATALVLLFLISSPAGIASHV